MAVRVEGKEQFREAALALRGADEKVLSEVAKSFRQVSKPVVAAVRDEVRSSKGNTERGGRASTVERQLHALARSGRGQLKPLTERQVRSLRKRLAKVESLRENIASASGAAVSANPKQVNLAFKVRAGQMPPSQRKLPRRWDQKGGWKHPVFGNRKVWVKQTGHPYFRSTIYERRPDIDAGVIAAFQTAGDRIMHPEEAA